MAPETKTVEIAFFGGATSARLGDGEIERLRAAVENREWVDIQTADGPLSLNGANVIFLRIDESSATIGFRS